jgi:hypothetical protein
MVTSRAGCACMRAWTERALLFKNIAGTSMPIIYGIF